MLIPSALAPAEFVPTTHDAQRIDLAGETMGTNWSLKGYAPASLDPDALRTGIGNQFASYTELFSTWTPESFISSFNAAPAGTQLTPPPAFATVLQRAIEIADASEGAFNPAVGGGVAAAGFGSPYLRPERPRPWNNTRQYLSAAQIFQPGALQLDLSAIAKGAAVDALAAFAKWSGFFALLVEIGGEYVGVGVKPDGMPWWIDIEPTHPEQQRWRIAACGVGVATSGDAHAVRLEDEVRTSHLICLDTQIDKNLRSVTVIQPTCMEADAWATALFASGAAGQALANDRGIPALFLYQNGDSVASPAAATMLDT